MTTFIIIVIVLVIAGLIIFTGPKKTPGIKVTPVPVDNTLATPASKPSKAFKVDAATPYTKVAPKKVAAKKAVKKTK